MSNEVSSDYNRVLVVDDDFGDLCFVRNVLKNRHVMIEARNGKEAVYLSQSHKPDIIFMDMMMPEMDGLTALAEIKANEATKAIPIVILTGISYDLNKQLADSLGASGYMTKPFKSQELLDIIRKLL